LGSAHHRRQVDPQVRGEITTSGKRVPGLKLRSPGSLASCMGWRALRTSPPATPSLARNPPRRRRGPRLRREHARFAPQLAKMRASLPSSPTLAVTNCLRGDRRWLLVLIVRCCRSAWQSPTARGVDTAYGQRLPARAPRQGRDLFDALRWGGRPAADGHSHRGGPHGCGLSH
jgi:hypothetical protein